MNQETAIKILDIQDRIQSEAQYRRLMEEHEYTGERFSRLLPTLTQEEQDIILKYLGVFNAIYLKTLELALE